MTTTSAPPALTDIGFSWRGHRAALWWLGLLYRKSDGFQEAFKKVGRGEALKLAGVLAASAIPYCLAIKIIIFAVITLLQATNVLTFADFFFFTR